MTVPLLLTGASGYVGSRLLEAFETQERPVRCVARRPDALQDQVAVTTEVVEGDVMDEASLRPAMRGCEVAYYLVHRMNSPGDFEAEERLAAEAFVRAAKAEGISRIVYLGGLGDPEQTRSPHLRSRHETGRIFRDSGVQTIELRAGVILGADSLSFEMIRALVERLPIMITPKWVGVATQPIAIGDVIRYLVEAADREIDGSRVFEIGGADRTTYGGMMREYARQRGLHRVMLPVPFLTPRISALWLALVTPLYARVGRRLVESIRSPTVVRDDSALNTFHVVPLGLEGAVRRALEREDERMRGVRWNDAISFAEGAPPWGGKRFGSRLADRRSLHVGVSPAVAFEPIRRIGGDTGWYHASILWRLRGMLDILVGGVGARRGRRDPDTLRVGDAVDFWRVEAYEPDHRLLLRAEMRLPGRAWLEFTVERDGDGSTINQVAVFDPVGLFGLAYWYSVFFLHDFVFSGMLRAIARRAERGLEDPRRGRWGLPPHEVQRY